MRTYGKGVLGGGGVAISVARLHGGSVLGVIERLPPPRGNLHRVGSNLFPVILCCIPPRSGESVRRASNVSELDRDLRAMSADGAAWSVMVGVGETYLPAFVLALSANQTASGLVATVPLMAGAVLQMLALRGTAFGVVSQVDGPVCHCPGDGVSSVGGCRRAGSHAGHHGLCDRFDLLGRRDGDRAGVECLGGNPDSQGCTPCTLPAGRE